MIPPLKNSEPQSRPRRIFRIAAIVATALIVLGCIEFVVSVHALRDHFSSGPQWAFPSRVYSDVLAFTPGLPMPIEYLQAHLALRGYRPAVGQITKPGTY